MLSAADLGLGAEEVGEPGSRTRVLGVRRPPAREPGMLIEDEERAAEQLMEFLATKGVI